MIEWHEPECNGICVMGYEFLEGASGVAYPHPDCELHGDSNRYLEDDYYEQRCEQEVEIGEWDAFERDPGLGTCGGKVVCTGGQSYYNGSFQCYTMYLHCDRCGDYEVECV